MTNVLNLPKHIAIVIDGNGRWAQARKMPRLFGHRAGLEAVRRTIKSCAEKKIEVLTLFAFSSENWKRPTDEVSGLMNLFLSAFKSELKALHNNNIQIRFIGDFSQFNQALQEWILKAHELTQNNTGLKLVVAVNYGGQWDITQAAQKVFLSLQEQQLSVTTISPAMIEKNLATADFPNPDLFIRTSGEQRISNFLLWQLAYSELYFTDVLWPDFSEQNLEQALTFYATRERRFGYTGEQVRATLMDD